MSLLKGVQELSITLAHSYAACYIECSVSGLFIESLNSAKVYYYSQRFKVFYFTFAFSSHHSFMNNYSNLKFYSTMLYTQLQHGV